MSLSAGFHGPRLDELSRRRSRRPADAVRSHPRPPFYLIFFLSFSFSVVWHLLAFVLPGEFGVFYKRVSGQPAQTQVG